MRGLVGGFETRWPPRNGSRRGALAIVVALHAAAVFAWWQLPPGAMQRAVPVRMLATIVSAQATDGPAPAPMPVVPAAPRTKAKVAPLPAVPAREDTPVSASMPQPVAATAPAPFSASTTVPAAPEPAIPASAPSRAPVPVEPPRFDAAYLDNAPPAYPSLSRQFREQGVVMLDVRVTPAGLPEAVDVRASSGSPRLDEAARAAVKRWRFVPARQGDTPVAAWVVVPVRFSLAG